MIGIDLGTAFSCVAVVKNGRAEVLGEGARRTIPSCLAFARGKEVVGDAARRQALTDPTNTVSGVKRLMGHGYDSPEVQTARERVVYAIRPSPMGSVTLEVGGRDLTPVQVSARVLQKIKNVAEEALGEAVERAVISVPAHFNDVQRKATKLAAEYAGLDVLRLVNEPTAAAFAYGYRKGEDFTLAVYDLGGGTFDITVMLARGDCFEVVATDGDSYLGGEDFDHAIASWLRTEFEQEHGHDLKGNHTALLRLKDAAERSKIQLSEVAEAQIELPFLAQLPDGTRPGLSRVLTRDKLAELTGPLVERTLELTRRCLEEARVGVKALDEVLLVGGQSRMPQVRAAVKEFFGKEPRRDINPDEVVAMGAALYAYSLAADDLQEKAEEAAGDAYAIALKGKVAARKVVDGIRKIGSAATSLDLPAVRDRLRSLMTDAELPAPRTSGEDLPAARGTEESDLPSAREARETDLPTRSTGVQDDDADLPDTAGGLPQQRRPDQLPHAIEDLRTELNVLSSEAQEAISALSAEIRDSSAAQEATPEMESEALESAVDQLSSQLSQELETRLDSARDQSRAVESHLSEASEHRGARRIDLVDVTSLALGIHAAGDLFTVLIDHNTRVPCEQRRMFTTNQDQQQEVHIRVHQGREATASRNQLLGEFILEGIPLAARMEPKIEVCFAIDADGILGVTAKDAESNAAQSIRVNDPLGLQQTRLEDLEKQEREAAEKAEQVERSFDGV